MRIVYVARHGETDWNAAGRWQGHTDVPLNVTGRAQARSLVASLAHLSIGGAVSSDLSRAHETARIVADGLGIAVAYVDRDLRERSFGVFEGLTREECAERHPEAWRAWIEHRVSPGGAESQDAISARMVAAVGRVAERVSHETAPALVVTHGGAIRALVSALTGEMPQPVRNGEVWELQWDAGLVAARPLFPLGGGPSR
jgi:broad specificity phosphatase PhoE